MRKPYCDPLRSACAKLGAVGDVAWRFGVLGPVEVWRDDQLVRIRSQKQRAVLALLLLQANRVAGVDAIIDGLWGDEPPATAAATVQVHIANLRKALAPVPEAPTPIATRPPGYVVAVESGNFDLTRFEELVRRGRAEIARGKPAEASSLLARALACWRGAALADVADEPFAAAAVVRLREERLSAVSDRIGADLARGAHAEVVGELRALTAEHPLQERFWEQLIVALYRCGSQADALGAFQSARSTLRDHLGIEPGAPLRALETAVLDQASSLDWQAPSPSAASAPVASTILEYTPDVAHAHLDGRDGQVLLGPRTTIGRHPSNAVVLDDPKVSREHAVIRAADDGFVFTDLHSTNGSFVNGARVDEVALSDGDCIGVGDREFVFRLDEH
jgi:DNA-binding SARP family transcriptional activator